MFCILYVTNILLSSKDHGLLQETKSFLSKNFEMQDIGDTSYVLGIEIYHNMSKRILGLSQKPYINKILKKFNM